MEIPPCGQHYLRKRKRKPQPDEILKVSPIRTGFSPERDLRPIKWGARRKICYKNPETSLQIVVRKERDQMSPNAESVCHLNAPKGMQARWSNERYRAAQEFLIDILHAKKAVPGSPIARQELRIEARKYIGDTGLLDHLLKRMTDQVVVSGERFRRRHNLEGGMEYWLEDASLMELRKSANIRDPWWVPPAGWKAGDPLVPLCESEEVKHLKAEVDYLRSELQMLSRPELALPCEADIITQPSPSSLTEKSFKETVKNKLESLNSKVEELQAAYSQLHTNKYLFQKETTFASTNTNSGVQVESADKEGFDGNVLMERLEKLELEVHKMVQENKARQEMLAVEKLTLETQFANLWKVVMTMQDKLSVLEEQHNQGRSAFAPCAPRTLSNEVTHHAFKPCKPPGTFAMPTVSSGREKSSTFQLEEILSPRKSSSQVTMQMGRGTHVGDTQQLFFTAAMQALQDGLRDNHETRTSWLGLSRSANELQIQGLVAN